MTWAIIYCIFSVIMTLILTIYIMRCDGKFTVGDLFVALFLIVLSPITWIVIGILELHERGFFKKVIWKRNKKNKLCG